jgi:hypothetical protein
MIRALRIRALRIRALTIRALTIRALTIRALTIRRGLSRPRRPGRWPHGPVRGGGRGSGRVFVAALVFLVFLHRLAGPLACLRDSRRAVFR